jgi:predicted AAA+ superfamily ATPase
LALRSLEDVFGRIQALWKPVATEEAFEIVRRRLFEPIKDLKARDAVCRAFADAYFAEGPKLPSAIPSWCAHVFNTAADSPS